MNKIMSKKGQLSVGEIVVLFMGVIVALAFIPQIFDTQTIMTDKQPVTDESLDISSAINVSGDINSSIVLSIANAQTGWQLQDCPIDSFVIGNATDDFTVTTDYTFNANNGTLFLEDTAVVRGSNPLNTSLVDYTFCQDGYNTDSGARGVAGLIGLFSVLILLGFVVFYLDRSGIMNLGF